MHACMFSQHMRTCKLFRVCITSHVHEPTDSMRAKFKKKNAYACIRCAHTRLVKKSRSFVFCLFTPLTRHSHTRHLPMVLFFLCLSPPTKQVLIQMWNTRDRLKISPSSLPPSARPLASLPPAFHPPCLLPPSRHTSQRRVLPLTSVDWGRGAATR